MSLQRVPINNFRGGLNTRDSPFELQPNESPDCQNVSLTALVGQLQVRKGRLKYNQWTPPTIASATPVAGGGTFAAGTYFYKVAILDNDGAQTTGSAEVSATVALNGHINLVINNIPGFAAQMILYRSTVSGGQTSSPAVVTSFSFPLSTVNYTDTGTAVTAGAIPTAFYLASLTNQIDNAKQIVLNPVANQYAWLMLSCRGNVYAMDSRQRIFFLHSGAANSIWDFAQMPDATGADKVWMCNGVDTPQKWDGLQTTTSAWSNAITAWARSLVWKNKMVVIEGIYNSTAANPYRVYFSKPGDPEAANGTYDFTDLRGDDDDIQALTEMNVLADRLYVFKERTVWLFTDANTFANRRIGEPGCLSRFQSDVCNEKLYFLNVQGLWSTAGVAVAYESGSINNYFTQHLTVFAANKARLLTTRDTYQRLLLSLPVDGSSSNNAVFEVVPNLNFRRIGGRRYLLLPAFLPHTWDASCLVNANWGSGQWGNFCGGTATPGNFYQLFDGTTDDGTAVSAHWQSAWMAIQGEEPFERVRRLNVELQGDARVEVFSDFKAAPDFGAQLPAGAPLNLLPDPNFDTDGVGSLAGWRAVPTALAPDFFSVANDWSNSPPNSFGARNLNTTPGTYAVEGPHISVSPGYPYNVSGVLNVLSLQSNCSGVSVSLIFYDPNGSYIVTGGSPTTYTAGVNNFVTLGAIAPSNAATVAVYAAFILTAGGSTGSTNFRLDDLVLFSTSGYRFARVRPESRGRFHSVKVSTVAGGQPFQINVMEMVVRGGKEH